MRPLAACALVTALLSATAASAFETRSETLECFVDVGLLPGPPTAPEHAWATLGRDETSPSQGTSVQSVGFTFPSPIAEETEIQCSWIVPDDFVLAGETSVRLVGWAMQASPALAREVRFALHVRSFEPDDYLPVPGGGRRGAPREMSAPWTPTDAGTLLLDATPGFPPRVVADHLRAMRLDADAAFGLLASGKLAVFRITRERVSDVALRDYVGSFHVARLRITYQAWD